MEHNNNFARMIADYEERRKSLLADGYRQRHETILEYGAVCRLHHMANGNDIVLTALRDTLTQKTNGVITHQKSYDDGDTLYQH